VNCSLAALTLFLFPLVLTTFSISLRVGCFSLSLNTYSTKTLAAAGLPLNEQAYTTPDEPFPKFSAPQWKEHSVQYAQADASQSFRRLKFP
jgi:hypothetical protein